MSDSRVLMGESSRFPPVENNLRRNLTLWSLHNLWSCV